MLKALTLGLVVTTALAVAGSGLFIFDNLNFSQIENIHGIPYPAIDNNIVVTEELAHADIYLNATTLAKSAELTVTFDPKDISSLFVGIRENSFWLSYEKHQVYNSNFLPLTKGESGPPTAGREGVYKKTISIPLTDKLVDKNSLDLMFFAESEKPINWELVDLQVSTQSVTPSLAELKDFIRSRLTQEKAL